MKLTDEEILKVEENMPCDADGVVPPLAFARAIEAAVLEKVGKVDVEPVCWHEPGSPHNEPVYNNVTGHKKWALINGWQPLYPASALAALRAQLEAAQATIARQQSDAQEWARVNAMAQADAARTREALEKITTARDFASYGAALDAARAALEKT